MKPCSRRLRCHVLLWTLLFLCPTLVSHAQHQSQPMQTDVGRPVDAHLPLLEQLMQQEMQQMHLIADQTRDGHQRQHSGNRHAISNSVASKRDSALSASQAIDVLAVYGVGEHSFIELRHEGQQYRYVSGQTEPVGWARGDAPLKLRRIVGNCASFDHSDGVVKVCLASRLLASADADNTTLQNVHAFNTTGVQHGGR